jgi:rhodanese-related sulfurtransferase
MRMRNRRSYLPVRILLLTLSFAPMALAGEGAPPVATITPADAAAQVNAGDAVLVDVRERNELDAGMAQGARWYPTSSIKSDPDAYVAFLASLPADQTVVFYCASGVRSGKAAELARQKTGRKTANLGGFKDWKSAGLPVTTPAKTLSPG